MKVILLGELRGKGGEGDVVDVAQGYAENYLFRNKIAQPATPCNLKQLEQRRDSIAKREAERISNAEATKAVLDEKVIYEKAGDRITRGIEVTSLRRGGPALWLRHLAADRRGHQGPARRRRRPQAHRSWRHHQDRRSPRRRDQPLPRHQCEGRRPRGRRARCRGACGGGGCRARGH